MNIVILAAGQGKRMFSDLPKVLHPLAGKALVQHVVDTAQELNPATLCVVYGHGGDLVKNAVIQDEEKAGISFALQAEQLGTGHAVQQAMPYLTKEEITLVLYGDVPLTSPQTLQNLLAKAQDALAVLTVTLDDPKGYGRIVKDTEGRVTAIVEEKDASDEIRKITEINTGIMAIPTALLAGWLSRLSNRNAQKEYYLTDIVAMAVADGVPVVTAQPDFEWEVLGVNSQVQLAYLERVYQTNTAQELLEEGVHLADPTRLDVRGSLLCGRDVFIDVGCVFEGSVVLEDGVKIAPYCVIKNAIIGKNVVIEAFSHLNSTIIRQNAKIGPYARLRPGTELLEEVHVGNFVEIKKSTVGKKSKVNHLSYIGDTVIGERVNVGAGTITCNYDGVNKFQTIIEDDVFIGSDTQLVAPVTVRRGATLGAGTTLTKDAPADTLTISRAKQVSIEGWKRPVKKAKT